jgi:hypothetical protein
MAPDAQMTVEEQACCRMMKNQCGPVEMPASHDCCKKSPKSLQDSVLKTDPVTFCGTAFVALWVSSIQLLAPQAASQAWVRSVEHSPPKSPPSEVTALRI